MNSQPLSPKALERRLKRHFLKETHSFFAVCALGFEDVLEAELGMLVMKNRQGDRETGRQGDFDFSPILPSPLPPF